MFSGRTAWPNERNRLTACLGRLQKEGRSVLDLTESNPTRCRFQYPADLLKALTDPASLTYVPSPRGGQDARDTIAAYYSEKGISVHPDEVFLTASTSEAYSFLFRLLFNPGEALLLPRPGYPLLEYLGTLNDVHLVPYPLRYTTRAASSRPASGWEIDREALEQAVGPKTRAVVLVHPNHPTGSFVKKDEADFLTALSARKQLSLICDEVFLDYAYGEDPSRVPTFAGGEAALTFTLSGISKVLGLPQMKLSWIIVRGPGGIREAAMERLEVIADTYLSVNTPSQQALPAWFAHRLFLKEQIQERVLSNRRFLERRCRDGLVGCRLLSAEGSWAAVLGLPETQDEEAWALRFLEQASVLVHPGYFFDFEKGTQVVLSLLVPTDVFQEGVSRILASL